MSSSKTRYDRVCDVIYYLRDAKPNERTLDRISRNMGLPYSSVRLIIRQYYPHCFKEKQHVGWFITGAQPEPDIPFDFNAKSVERSVSYHTEQQQTQAPVVTTNDSGRKGWIWDQSALRYLDTLWPGSTFAEVLDRAIVSGTTDQLVILGKTLTKAAMEAGKNGNTNFLRQ